MALAVSRTSQLSHRGVPVARMERGRTRYVPIELDPGWLGPEFVGTPEPVEVDVAVESVKLRGSFPTDSLVLATSVFHDRSSGRVIPLPYMHFGSIKSAAATLSAAGAPVHDIKLEDREGVVTHNWEGGGAGVLEGNSRDRDVFLTHGAVTEPLGSNPHWSRSPEIVTYHTWVGGINARGRFEIFISQSYRGTPTVRVYNLGDDNITIVVTPTNVSIDDLSVDWRHDVPPENLSRWITDTPGLEAAHLIPGKDECRLRPGTYTAPASGYVDLPGDWIWAWQKPGRVLSPPVIKTLGGPETLHVPYGSLVRELPDGASAVSDFFGGIPMSRAWLLYRVSSQGVDTRGRFVPATWVAPNVLDTGLGTPILPGLRVRIGTTILGHQDIQRIVGRYVVLRSRYPGAPRAYVSGRFASPTAEYEKFLNPASGRVEYVRDTPRGHVSILFASPSVIGGAPDGHVHWVYNAESLRHVSVPPENIRDTIDHLLSGEHPATKVPQMPGSFIPGIPLGAVVRSSPIGKLERWSRGGGGVRPEWWEEEAGDQNFLENVTDIGHWEGPHIPLSAVIHLEVDGAVDPESAARHASDWAPAGYLVTASRRRSKE